MIQNHRPVAAVSACHRLENLAQAAEDLRDLGLILARTADDSGTRTSLDDLLTTFGHTRESLSALPDDE